MPARRRCARPTRRAPGRRGCWSGSPPTRSRFSEWPRTKITTDPSSEMLSVVRFDAVVVEERRQPHRPEVGCRGGVDVSLAPFEATRPSGRPSRPRRARRVGRGPGTARPPQHPERTQARPGRRRESRRASIDACSPPSRPVADPAIIRQRVRRNPAVTVLHFQITAAAGGHASADRPMSFFVDSPAFMAQLERDVAAASRSIHAQVMSFEGDEAGRRFASLLAGRPRPRSHAHHRPVLSRPHQRPVPLPTR